MTRHGIKEYAEELKKKYFGDLKKREKGKMIDEFTQVTGLHRKAATRMLNGSSRSGAGKRGGRLRKSGIWVAEVLKEVWEAGKQDETWCQVNNDYDTPRIPYRCLMKAEILSEVNVKNWHTPVRV